MGEEPAWIASVPPPEAVVIKEEGKYRAELINYIQKGERVKDIRVRGPVRQTRKEALKDAAELRRAALRSGHDPALFQVRNRRKELEATRWKDKDLVGPDVEDHEEEERMRRRDEGEQRVQQMKKEEEAKKQKEMSFEESITQIMKKHEAAMSKFKPVGPNWKRPGSLVDLPMIRGHPDHPSAWMIHERQDSTGKYRPWLYFSTAAGKYYRPKDSGTGFVQTGVPHDPREFSGAMHVGSACLPAKSGKKLDMAVLLNELHKTGFLLKQPLEFLDKPASLFVLCDGLRCTAAAAEFCAKRFHTMVFPKLSARATEWEDFELVDILREAVEALDALLLESPHAFAGCSLAVALLVGTRLVLGGIGGVRCILCRPPHGATATRPTSAAAKAARAAAESWTPQLVAGGDAHTTDCEDERLRIESAGGCLLSAFGADAGGLGAGREVRACSAKPVALAAIPDERERLLWQVALAMNPFAALGLSPEHLKQGAAAVRRIFRKMSLVVHPDKVGEVRRQVAASVFAKLEASASAVEQMLQADATATALVAELDAAHDTGKVAADPAVAAKLLGVAEGAAEKSVKAAAKAKFHAALGRLQNVARRDVERAFKILEVAEEAVSRGTKLWQPADADEGVRVTRALGCKDLKAPVPILSSGLVAECVELEPGCLVGVALLSDGAAGASEADVAAQLARHAPARPRAAALRIALDGSKRYPAAAVGAVCMYFDYEGVAGGFSASAPPLKRVKTMKPDRVRVSHILLRWAGLKGDDEFARPGVEPPTRTQMDAERELLELLESLAAGEQRTIGTRFKAEVLKRSECASALNVPYADLGWIEQGSAEPALEAAAFNTAVGGLSDVIVSTRGVHLMHRLA